MHALRVTDNLKPNKMKNLLIAIVMLYVGVTSAQDTPTLTVSGTTYDLIADRNFDVGTSVAYTQGYERGLADSNTSGTVTSAAVKINQYGEVEIMYETDLDFSIGAINPLVRITIFSDSNPSGVAFIQYRLSALASTEFIGLGDIHAPDAWNRFQILIMNEHGSIARRENLPITYIP